MSIDLSKIEDEALRDEIQGLIDAEISAHATAAKKSVEKKLKAEADSLRTQLDEAIESRDELQTQLDEVAEGGSAEASKVQKSLDKLQKQMDGLTAKNEALEVEKANLAKGRAIDGITGGLNLHPERAAAARKLLESELSQVEDLDDSGEVSSVVKKFEEENPWAFNSGVKSGAGSQGTQAPTKTNGGWTPEKIAGLGGKELTENFAEAFEAAGKM